MKMSFIILFYFGQCFQIILNSTGEIIREFCVNHQQKNDLYIYVDNIDTEQFDMQWDLIFIYTDEAMSVNGCLTQQYQKRAYFDWAVRLGNQILNSTRQEFNFTLQEPNQYYNLIQMPYIDKNFTTQSQTGTYFLINSIDLKKNSDYFIKFTAKSKFIKQEQIIQVRVMVQQSDQYPRSLVTFEKLVASDESFIQLQTDDLYDWKIFIKDPIRFGFIQTSISAKNTQMVNISLTPTWTDKLYIVTIILLDKSGLQFYQTDWFHQIGQQWTNQSQINCSYESLSDSSRSNWAIRLSCLEWSSLELHVLLPQYDYIYLQQITECSEQGRLQQSYQPLPFCVCKDNFTGITCNQSINETIFNLTQSYFSILISEFVLQNLDKYFLNNFSSSFQRTHYLLVKQTQGNDQLLFDLINGKNFYFGQQILLTYDTLIIKSILNNQTSLINSTFKAISNLKNLFEVVGIFQFTNVLFYISTINQLTNLSNGTVYYMSFQQDQNQEFQSECIFLSPNFVFAQMILYSAEISYKTRQNVFSQYMTCDAYTLNGNLILNINTNMTIITNYTISSISRPTQLRCASNSSNNTCRIHRLYDNYAQVSFDSNHGPYIVERSPIVKSVDYQTLLDSIKNQSYQQIIFHCFVAIALMISQL